MQSILNYIKAAYKRRMTVDFKSKHQQTSAPEDAKCDDSYQLHLIIVGAGLAGLAAAISTRLEGHRVTVLEKVTKLEEVGAGLQVTPNATRLFKHWGVFDEIQAKAAIPSYLAVRRYDGTRLLAREENFQDKMLDRYGAPFWDLHRADLQVSLVRRAKELGVDMRLGADVVDVDFDHASVTTADGTVVSGDLVLGADGLWSRTRKFLTKDATPKPTGDLAYRIILNVEDIPDPDLRDLVSKPSANFWVGPETHAVGYSVRSGQQYNIVLLRPDDLPEDVSRAAADIEEMRRLFHDWDPILNKLLACVDSVDKWRLMHMDPLSAWTNDKKNFLMAGDSCHPMLPYLAQGANSSLEDGAVLGRLLGKVKKSRDQIAPAVGMYEQLRKSRGEGIVRETFGQRNSFHLPDGPAQQERDELFLKSLGAEALPSPFPSRWTCPSVQPWLYGYDAVVQADKAYQTAPF